MIERFFFEKLSFQILLDSFSQPLMRIRRFSRKKRSCIIKEPRLMQFRNQSDLLKASEIARTKEPQTLQETDLT